MFFRARNSFPVLPPAVGQSRTDSGWSMVALAILLAVVAGVVIALVALLGGGRESVASRSAAAFDEAQRKGIPVGEAAHAGHGAASPGGEPGDHTAAEKPAAAAGHAGMEMQGQGKAGMAGHAGMEMPGQGKTGMAGHAGMEMPAQGKTGMAEHGVAGSAPPAPLVEKAATAGPGQPAATLEPDPLDAPTETSEMDAKRSTELARGMGAGGHGMMHGTGSYRQLDAGRESVQKAETGMPDHQGMGHGSMPPSTPTPAPMKPRPAVTPPPTPGGHVHPGGGHR
jgi:hypothetical protein